MQAWLVLQGHFVGQQTPCRDRSEWTSRSKADKATAIRLCGDCPAKAACHEYAETAGERGAVWGGVAR
ncbi:WhiB family transcriptional regulator [Brevibacterium zhoupengii]|uniref:WhiB family transcriptional regulator n=1 Tax=Brevibacterium zhoupengii TaxID=2898795 RepID=UPI00374DB23E